LTMGTRFSPVEGRFFLLFLCSPFFPQGKFQLRPPTLDVFNSPPEADNPLPTDTWSFPPAFTVGFSFSSPVDEIFPLFPLSCLPQMSISPYRGRSFSALFFVGVRDSFFPLSLTRFVVLCRDCVSPSPRFNAFFSRLFNEKRKRPSFFCSFDVRHLFPSPTNLSGSPFSEFLCVLRPWGFFFLCGGTAPFLSS